MAESLRNIKMVLGYDGTAYAGFQRQRPGVVTIQGTIEAGLGKLTGSPVTIYAAGRTDAGVHANGQVINFKTTSLIPVEKIQQALNAILPKDILIKTVQEADADFHSRYSVIAKTYCYRIHQGPLRPLFTRQYVYHYHYPLELELMKEAISQIIGCHDFKAFQAAGSSVKSTIRTVHYCSLSQNGPELIFLINADGFLYHMVRNIVGSLLWVGNRRISIPDFAAILEGRDRNQAGPTAPSWGLCLEEVYYE